MRRFNRNGVAVLTCAVAALGLLALAGAALANGGPFVLKHPGGDPAAKGVLARLAPDLKPGRETRLQVVREDLEVRFEPAPAIGTGGKNQRPAGPVAFVAARYFITNPTPETVTVDFGFPIMRGIYISPFAMMPRPDVRVVVDGTNHIVPEILSNSAIYGALRRKAAAEIETALQADETLRERAQALGAGASAEAREALVAFLAARRHWKRSDAELLADYLALRPAASAGAAGPAAAIAAPGAMVRSEATFSFAWGADASLRAAAQESAWSVQCIGEQKATQWLTWLAACLDPAHASSYEALFEAWGGDVRERSVDLATGRVRPRENESAASAGQAPPRAPGDGVPTVYARVDYLETGKNLPAAQKAAWERVLKNLPVVFTFAPMNLLHYQVAFAPGALRTVKVLYRQYPYEDSAAPASYQLAYVLHPASLWDSFGPIRLTVVVPQGVIPVSSMPLNDRVPVPQPGPGEPGLPPGRLWQAFSAPVSTKTGELFVGLSAADWARTLEGWPGFSLLSVKPGAAK